MNRVADAAHGVIRGGNAGSPALRSLRSLHAGYTLRSSIYSGARRHALIEEETT
jgi:hypothetical protein